MSNAGKSLITAGLLRVFKQDGYKVCPFKSQNMALNSYITEEGLEMGRAQVMQAEAAGIKPSVYMNPILLKPSSDVGSQVIVNGEVLGNMKAKDYFKYKEQLIPDIKKAFNRLSEEYDIIVIEGAGSPAEINLKQNDIVNMGMAEMVDAPVLLVGDIDRGGVFAQLIGTLVLLTESERDRVKGLIINKFRGDKTILDPGIAMLNDMGGVPYCGVLPYMKIQVDDEDSLSERLDNKKRSLINIGVIRLNKLSNFTDFSRFEEIDGVSVIYLDNPHEVEEMDMIILPGSKNTCEDMIYLRESGFESAIIKYAKNGPVIGICGGFQMMGEMISDPYKVESGRCVKGLSLLPLNTVILEEKKRTNLKGEIPEIDGFFDFLSGEQYEGYEIHMGETVTLFDEKKDQEIISELENKTVNNAGNEPVTFYARENCFGTYMHGIFDYGDIAKRIVDKLAEGKGVKLDIDMNLTHRRFKEKQYDILADTVREYLDMDYIYSILTEAKCE